MLDEIAFSFDGGAPPSLFAGARRGRPHAEVRIWSRAERRELAAFPVDCSVGARRVALLAGAAMQLFCAEYHELGVSAYDANGARSWQRPDLLRVQSIIPFRDGEGRDRLALGAQDLPLCILDPATGETLDQVEGASRAHYGSGGRVLYEAFALVDGAAEAQAVVFGSDHAAAGEVPSAAHRVELDECAVLDAAFSDDAVAFSEVGGALRCFSAAGEPRWELGFGKRTHALEVAWNRALGRWIAVVWAFGAGGEFSLQEISPGGEVLARTDLGKRGAHRLARSGDLLVLGDGRVLELGTGVAEWNCTADRA